LPRQLLAALCAVVGAAERCQESNQIVDIFLGQGQKLDIFVEKGILQTVPLVVMVDDIPERFLGAVMKGRARHQHIAQVRRFEGSGIGQFANRFSAWQTAKWLENKHLTGQFATLPTPLSAPPMGE
jgi:hypothetical protein